VKCSSHKYQFSPVKDPPCYPFFPPFAFLALATNWNVTQGDRLSNLNPSPQQVFVSLWKWLPSTFWHFGKHFDSCLVHWTNKLLGQNWHWQRPQLPTEWFVFYLAGKAWLFKIYGKSGAGKFWRSMWWTVFTFTLINAGLQLQMTSSTLYKIYLLRSVV